MESKLKPPFGRIGNKMPMMDILLNLIPEHKLYVEVFAGSAALFFNKEPTKSILNDTDDDVIYRLKLLKKVPLFDNPNEKYTLDELKQLFDIVVRLDFLQFR
jgi:site-specific DNA-adenine methylase